MPDNDDTREPTLFSVRLTPHRSLSAKGFLAVMAATGGIGFIGGLVFFLVGAWPVVGFLALDMALVYWAFRVNYGAAAAYEEVTVTPSELRLRKASHRGQPAEWTANPLWVRLDRQADSEFRLRHLFLVTRGQRLAIGGFLPPSEKESLANALLAALAEARRGPTRTVIP